ncbi:MAG: hypothetical protein VST70_05245 [Nitrospirota bacterium]|nr:hypothetical protein [Nitrospirota bacterium]
MSIPRASYGPEGGEWWLRRTDGGVLVAADPPEENPVVVDRTGRLKYPAEGRENETYY